MTSIKQTLIGQKSRRIISLVAAFLCLTTLLASIAGTLTYQYVTLAVAVSVVLMFVVAMTQDANEKKFLFASCMVVIGLACAYSYYHSLKHERAINEKIRADLSLKSQAHAFIAEQSKYCGILSLIAMDFCFSKIHEAALKHGASFAHDIDVALGLVKQSK